MLMLSNILKVIFKEVFSMQNYSTQNFSKLSRIMLQVCEAESSVIQTLKATWGLCCCWCCRLWRWSGDNWDDTCRSKQKTTTRCQHHLATISAILDPLEGSQLHLAFLQMKINIGVLFKVERRMLVAHWHWPRRE